MWCPSLKGLVLVARRASAEAQALAAELSEALTTGHPLSFSRENVENLNSLQVANSERYLFSSSDDFDLVRQMLDEHPELGTGPRFPVQ